MDISQEVTLATSVDTDGNMAKIVADRDGTELIAGYTLNDAFVNRVEAAFNANPAWDLLAVDAIVETLARGDDPVVATKIEVGFALIHLVDSGRILLANEHKEPELVP